MDDTIADPFAGEGAHDVPIEDQSVDDLMNTVDLFPDDSGTSAPSAPAATSDPRPPAPAGPPPSAASAYAASAGVDAPPAAYDDGDIFPEDLDLRAGAGGGRANGAGGIMEVTVSDPEKKGDGLQAYVTYKVSTKTETSPGQFEQHSVHRRYSDFYWLREQLSSKYRGWLIPPLPEKAIYGRFNPMFVDSRRRGLELFLNRVARHHALAGSADVQLFLYGGADFARARAGKGASQDVEGESSAASSGGGFFAFMSGVAQTVTNQFGGQKEREKTREDLQCEEVQEYADKLEDCVSQVHKSIAALTERSTKISSAWFDFGFACTILGQYETEQEEKHLGNAFAKLGNCSDRLSVLLTQRVDTQVIHFQEPFQDFLRVLGALKEMLKARGESQAAYNNALASLESKQASLHKYQGRPGKQARAMQVEQEVADAQRDVDAKHADLQAITQRVFEEVRRFRSEKRYNFKNAILDFVRMQIEHSRKIQHAWESVLPDIEALPFAPPE